MKLRRIEYKVLNARQKEIYNFQKVASLLADYGFNCIKLTDDWNGADFLACHVDGKTTLRVQLKGRACICTKYRGKSLWVAFPNRGDWYLMEHDKLASKVPKWRKSKSWRTRGTYHSFQLSQRLLEQLAEHKL